MTETREQFRERLAWTAYRAFMDHIKIDGAKEYDELLPETKDAMHAEAEAVYAQAIRDLLDHIGGMTIHDDVGGSESTDKMLRDFAAERGINFGEE